MMPMRGVDWQEASAVFMAAQDMARETGPEEMLLSAQKMAHDSKMADDMRGQATAMIASARGYAATESPEKALRAAVDVRKLFCESGMLQEEVMSLFMVAELQLVRGFADEALCVGREALHLCGKKGADQKLEILSLQVIVSALLALTQYDEALRTATRAESAAKRAGDALGEARACGQIAQAHLAKKSFAAALAKAEQAVTLCKAAKNTKGEAVSLQSLAEVHMSRRDGKSALETCARSVSLFREAGDSTGIASGLITTALAHELQEDYKLGLASAREALVLFRKTHDKRGELVAKEVCALLRRKLGKVGSQLDHRPQPGSAQRSSQYVPATSAPASLPMEPSVVCYRVCGAAETKRLSGMVALVTGASRGIGKGVAQMLAEAGAVVYVTGRSSQGKANDMSAIGSVDETAASFAKLGGTGVAVHADHSHEVQGRALVDLITQNHGRLDVLVNNAFYTPKPDMVFFSTPMWAQPTRFLNEQIAVGGFCHAANTLMFTPCLRRGKGVVMNISSAGSQTNAPAFPTSYLCNKAALDRSSAALAQQLRAYDVHVMSLWPGSVKSERRIAAAQQDGTKLIDLETTRFSGQAAVNIASMKPDELFRFSASHRILSSADIARFELDGHVHQSNLQTFASGARVAS